MMDIVKEEKQFSFKIILAGLRISSTWDRLTGEIKQKFNNLYNYYIRKKTKKTE